MYRSSTLCHLLSCLTPVPIVQECGGVQTRGELEVAKVRRALMQLTLTAEAGASRWKRKQRAEISSASHDGKRQITTSREEGKVDNLAFA
ncbi:unnamed protein product [Diplocarpon coronariae]